MSAPDPGLIYEPFPKQKKFHESAAKYRLFGGAAGPGKTKALLWEAIKQANRFPKVDTLLMRRTFAELEKSLLREFRNNVPRDLYRSYNDSKHVITWFNGSTTGFGYSAGENDIYQYQGGEFLFIGVDELTLFTLGQWQFLTSRNRCPVPGSRPNMAGATNPGNIGHAWVKALWIDHKPAPGMDRPEQYDAKDYDFIPALVSDNPIYANDREYLKTLNALPKHLRQAFLLGDWNVLAGQYFDVFDQSKHLRAGADIDRELQAWWPRWISVDWGFEHPSAVYWHAAKPSGAIVTYREFVANHLSPRDLGLAILERTRDEHIVEVFLSPDAFARRTSENTIAEQLGDVLVDRKIPRPAPADDDRVGGWLLMYQCLQTQYWEISDRCERLIECLPMLTRDPKHVEDVLKVPGDDPADSARYGLKSHLAPGRVPVEQRVRERLGAMLDPETKAIADPTSYAIRARQVEKEERQRDRPVKFGARRRPGGHRGLRDF